MTLMRARAVVPVPVMPRPEEAQALIEGHLRSDLGGRCVTWSVRTVPRAWSCARRVLARGAAAPTTTRAGP